MRTALVLGICLFAAPAAAQDSTFGEGHYVGDTAVDVVVRWTGRNGRPHGRVEVRAGGESQRVHDGAPAYAWAAGGERGALVAVVGASATVEVSFVPIENGRPGRARGTSVRRLAGADRSPIGAAVAPRPDGFAVFWQEASTENPGALYETYLARFDLDGRAVGESQRVNAAWPIADVTYLPAQRQYYFLLYFGGSDPRGTRLCGVHIREAGLTNAEHPWWASRPGMIDEARLVTRGDHVLAVYRDDGQLFETDVTAGRWGADPASAPRSHGRIPASTAFGLRATAQGIDVRRVDLSGG